MFHNYFILALRTIRKNRLYGVINILGLTIGITCCILIALFVYQEFSYDSFHADSQRIYRMEEVRYSTPESVFAKRPSWDTRAPEGVEKAAYMPMPLGPLLLDRYPEVEAYTRVYETGSLVERGKTISKERILHADANFFEMFSFPLRIGKPETVLGDPSNVVLTPALATKYFGEEDALGQSLQIAVQGNIHTFTVTGIADPPPANSSIDFDLVIRFENRPFYEFNRDRWTSFNTPVFVRLGPTADVQQFEEKVNRFAAEQYAETMAEERVRQGVPRDAKVMEFQASPLTGIHLDAAVEWPGVSNPLYSYILSAIAFLILMIACINYVLLAMARSSERMLEVGIRKAAGANRWQIALQFWGETQMLSVISAVCGVVLALMVLPVFNDLSSQSLVLDLSRDAGIIGIILGITLITGVVAGGYPALALSLFQPASVLKGKSSYRFNPRLTRLLLVFQYSLSIFLIVGSLVMYRQLDFVSNRNLGYQEEQLVVVPTYSGVSEDEAILMQRYRESLEDATQVVSVSGMAPAFTTGSTQYTYNVKGEEKVAYTYQVGFDFIETMGMDLVAGRDFSEVRDGINTGSVLINEALAADMGWENAIGKNLPWKAPDDPSTVIGVIKDFHFQSLEAPIRPMLLHMDQEYGSLDAILVRLRSGQVPKAIEEMRTAWSEVAPDQPFDYWFMDEAVAEQYAAHNRWMRIMGSGTFIAILIACMGLFGLAGLTAINRTREIGIRKVLGANIRQIMFLLNRGVAGLICISVVISAPLSWYVMNGWLSTFTYRIEMGPDLFLIAGAGAAAVAFVTVTWQSLQAALANPVDSLRSE